MDYMIDENKFLVMEHDIEDIKHSTNEYKASAKEWKSAFYCIGVVFIVVCLYLFTGLREAEDRISDLENQVEELQTNSNNYVLWDDLK